MAMRWRCGSAQAAAAAFRAAAHVRSARRLACVGVHFGGEGGDRRPRPAAAPPPSAISCVDRAAAADLARRGDLGLALAARARRPDRRARD